MDSQLAGFSSTSSTSPFDEPPLVDATSMDMDLEDPIHPHDVDMRGSKRHGEAQTTSSIPFVVRRDSESSSLDATGESLSSSTHGKSIFHEILTSQSIALSAFVTHYVESGSILRFGGHEGEEALVDILLSRLSNILDKHDRLHMPISLDLLDALSSFPTRDSYSDADSFQTAVNVSESMIEAILVGYVRESFGDVDGREMDDDESVVDNSSDDINGSAILKFAALKIHQLLVQSQLHGEIYRIVEHSPSSMYEGALSIDLEKARQSGRLKHTSSAVSVDESGAGSREDLVSDNLTEADLDMSRGDSLSQTSSLPISKSTDFLSPETFRPMDSDEDDLNNLRKTNSSKGKNREHAVSATPMGRRASADVVPDASRSPGLVSATLNMSSFVDVSMSASFPIQTKQLIQNGKLPAGENEIWRSSAFGASGVKNQQGSPLSTPSFHQSSGRVKHVKPMTIKLRFVHHAFDVIITTQPPVNPYSIIGIHASLFTFILESRGYLDFELVVFLAGHLDRVLRDLSSSQSSTAHSLKISRDLSKSCIDSSTFSGLLKWLKASGGLAGIVRRLEELFSLHLTSELTGEKFGRILREMLSPNQNDVLLCLEAIEKDLFSMLLAGRVVSEELFEQLLISLQGHVNSTTRDFSVRLLNMLYDHHHWQMEKPLPPKPCETGQVLVLRADIPLSLFRKFVREVPIHQNDISQAEGRDEFSLQSSFSGSDGRSDFELSSGHQFTHVPGSSFGEVHFHHASEDETLEDAVLHSMRFDVCNFDGARTKHWNICEKKKALNPLPNNFMLLQGQGNADGDEKWRSVGSYVLEIHIPAPVSSSSPTGVGPHVHLSTPLRIRLDKDSIYRIHQDRVEIEIPILRLHSAGFYDYRVVQADSQGKLNLVTSGRFVCFPPIKKHIFHEVWIDIEGAEWDSRSGSMVHHGSFSDVVNELEYWSSVGISCLVLRGAVEKPLHLIDCASDLARPSKTLGGEDGFRELVNEAHRLGIQLCVGIPMSLSLRSMHRRYESLTVLSLDEYDRRVPQFAPGPRGDFDKNAVLFNFRKLETWTCLARDLMQWITRYGVDGVMILNANTVPFVVEPNMKEMMRLDSDGLSHYSLQEIIDGVIVDGSRTGWSPSTGSSPASSGQIPSSEPGMNSESLGLKHASRRVTIVDGDPDRARSGRKLGYWGTKMRKFYPNPFLSRLTRELWSISSSCMLLADCPDGCSLSIAPLGDDSHMDDIIVSIAGAGAIPVSYEQSLTLLRAFEMAGKSHQRDSPGHSSVDDPYSSDILRAHLEGKPLVQILEESKMQRLSLERQHASKSAVPPPVDISIPSSRPPTSFDAYKAATRRVSRKLSHPHHRLVEEGTCPVVPQDRRKWPILARTTTAFSRAPLLAFGSAALAFIDLSFTLPSTVCTWSGEHSGWPYMFEVVTDHKETKGSIRRVSLPAPRIDSRALENHYRSRAALRESLPALKSAFCRVLPANFNWRPVHNVVAFARYTDDRSQICFVACNVSFESQFFYFDVSPCTSIVLSKRVYEVGEIMHNSVVGGNMDVSTPSFHPRAPEYYSSDELLEESHLYQLPGYTSLCIRCQLLEDSDTTQRLLFESSIRRLEAMMRNHTSDPRCNFIYKYITASLSSYRSIAETIDHLFGILPPTKDIQSTTAIIHKILVHYASGDTDVEARVIEFLRHGCENHSQSATDALSDGGSSAGDDILRRLGARSSMFADSLFRSPSLGPSDTFRQQLFRNLLRHNELGPIVFITPELAPWSTIGGVGVMVAELTEQLSRFLPDVIVISPYYNFNRNGETGYLDRDGIKWARNITTHVGPERVDVGVHVGRLESDNRTLLFLHQHFHFPSPYHSGGPTHQLQTVILLAKASLELLCQMRIVPSVIITNDWPCGLIAPYARSGHFGSIFQETTLLHIVHNLEEGYQGLIWPDDGTSLQWLHSLSDDLLFDPFRRCIDLSNAALRACDQWSTVSKSYRDDLMQSSVYMQILNSFRNPFAFSNGIRVQKRREKFSSIAPSHLHAKAMLQQKYFGREDLRTPVFSFVGRIVQQKGVHLILSAIETILSRNEFDIMVIVGGMANARDKYGQHCAWRMRALKEMHPTRFWCDPDHFFEDGSLVNLGSDFGLMPSLFEPSGVVQQEYFAGGTPVIAFHTGGLKDTVFEFSRTTLDGNGFLFMAHNHNDFVQALDRALSVFADTSLYEILRKNAYLSVLDNSVVARAWGREFCRLREKLWMEMIESTQACSSESSKDIEFLGIDPFLEPFTQVSDLSPVSVAEDLNRLQVSISEENTESPLYESVFISQSSDQKGSSASSKSRSSPLVSVPSSDAMDSWTDSHVSRKEEISRSSASQNAIRRSPSPVLSSTSSSSSSSSSSPFRRR